MERLHESGDVYRGSYGAGTAPRASASTPRPSWTRARLLPDPRTPVEWLEEENWFFRLSAYRDRLLAHYDAHPDWVLPPARRNEARRMIEDGLEDLSISRARIELGRAGAVGPRPDRLRLGRRALQLLHGPGVRAARRGPGGPLLAAGPAAHGEGHPEVPRRHLAGAADGRRARAAAAADDPRLRPQGRREDEQDHAATWSTRSRSSTEYGIDALRYYLAREVRFGEDGTFTAEGFEARYSQELGQRAGQPPQPRGEHDRPLPRRRGAGRPRRGP